MFSSVQGAKKRPLSSEVVPAAPRASVCCARPNKEPLLGRFRDEVEIRGCDHAIKKEAHFETRKDVSLKQTESFPWK